MCPPPKPKNGTWTRLGNPGSANGAPIWPRTLRDQNPGLLEPTLRVERGVEVRCFECSHVCLLLAARREERRREGPSLFPVDAAPQDARGRRTCYCAANAAAAAAGRRVAW